MDEIVCACVGLVILARIGRIMYFVGQSITTLQKCTIIKKSVSDQYLVRMVCSLTVDQQRRKLGCLIVQ